MLNGLRSDKIEVVDSAVMGENGGVSNIADVEGGSEARSDSNRPDGLEPPAANGASPRAKAYGDSCRCRSLARTDWRIWCQHWNHDPRYQDSG